VGVEAMNRLPDEFLTELRESCGPATWSQAVEFSRRDCVSVDQSGADDIRARVFDSNLRRGFNIALYVEDFDWECNCGGKSDPCVHVVAAAIVIRRSIEQGQELPVSKKNLGLLQYRFWRRDDGLKFERYIVGSDSEEVLKVPLTTHMATVSTGLMAAPTDQDYRVDIALAQERRGVLTVNTMHDLLRALVGHPHVYLDGVHFAVIAEPVGLMLEVRDEPTGVRVQGRYDDRIIEMYRNGVSRCKDGMRPIQLPSLSAEDARLVREGKWFALNQLAILETEVLPRLSEGLRVVNYSKRIRLAEQIEPRLVIEAEKVGRQISLRGVIAYGDPAMMVIRNHQVVQIDAARSVARDMDAERRLADELRRRAEIDIGTALMLSPDEAVERIQRWQARIPSPWLTDESLDRFKNLTELKLQVRWERNRLLVESSRGDQQTQLLATTELNLMRDAKARGSNLLEMPDGKWVKIPSQWLDQHADLLDVITLADGETKKPIRASVLVAQEESFRVGIANCPSAYPGDAVSPETWPLAKVASQPGFKAELREYQSHGAAWIDWLGREGVGGILADDMGLGKTVQVLAVIPRGSLIVVPATLIGNWLREFSRFRPDVPVRVYHGSDRRLGSSKDQITLTTYGVMRLDIETLSKTPFNMVVLDEAQLIRNPESQVANAACRLQAETRLALTGTPVENRIIDLWSLFRFVNPGLLGEQKEFSSRYASQVQDVNRMAALHRRVKPFMLRRRKREVAPELPPKTVSHLMVDLDDDESAKYLVLREKILAMLADPEQRQKGLMSFLPLLLRMRQVCSHQGMLPENSTKNSSKQQVLIAKVDELLAEDHRVLIFSQWTGFLDLIEEEFNQRGWKWLRIDGTTRDRMAIVDAFQSGQGAPILLVSLKAGGVGLNLTAADHVFILDPWWNPAAEEQAADRAYRIGQDKPVFVHKLIARNTIEERVIEMQQVKRELYEMAIEGGSVGISVTDIEDLVG
jgi:SNF2 family DNA or RNA helicase